MPTLFRYHTSDLVPLIDWAHFFHAWQVREGTKEADELLADANAFLARIASEEAALGMFRQVEARSQGDNIVVEDVIIPLLRQQTVSPDGNTLCLSDFISPCGSTIGIFATTSPVANPERTEGADPFDSLLRQTIAVRLAEAAAEKLQSDTLPGPRPAVGYPCMPDLSIIFILNQLCPLTQIGIQLTENGAMKPQASVCGLIIPHPQARYFSVGRIGDDQFTDYAFRRGMEPSQLRRFFKSRH